MLNPHWFGEVKHTQLSQNKRIFIFIGGGSIYKDSIQEIGRNHPDSGASIIKFEVWVIGKGNGCFFRRIIA
jgi:hypothetical protein